MKITQNVRGFTALELLIVIAIMSILIGLVLASFTSAKKSVTDKRALSTLQSVQASLEQYKLACMTYPKTLDRGANNSPSGTCATEFGDMVARATELDNVRYVSLRRVGNTNTSVCDGYHIGVVVDADSGLLDSPEDKDFDSQVPGVWVACDASGQPGDMGPVVFDTVSFGVYTGGLQTNQPTNGLVQ
jgi:prepilin-type N-terminal cleavage/methylation domain-containing protein